MKILVCFKTLPDLEQVLPSDWENFSPSSDLSYAKRILNCFDEAALELALRLRDSLLASGESVFCAAVTVGKAPPPLLRKSLFAVGFHKVEVLRTENTEFNPLYVASCLAQHCRAEQYDLILCGKQAGFADTGTVPLFLAQMLHLFLVTDLLEADSDGNNVTVERQTQNGRQSLRAALPLLATAGNSPHSALRAATLQSQLQAGAKTLTVTQLPPPPMLFSPVLYREKEESHCVFWQEETPQMFTERLWQTVRERLAVQQDIAMQTNAATSAAPAQHNPLCNTFHIALVLPADVRAESALSGLWTAVSDFAGECSLLLPQYSAKQAASLPVPAGISAIMCPNRDTPLWENAQTQQFDWLAEQVRVLKPDILLLAGSRLGQEWAARLALCLDIPYLPLADTLSPTANGQITAQKPVCSSYLMWQMQAGLPCICSIPAVSLSPCVQTRILPSGQIKVAVPGDSQPPSPVLWQKDWNQDEDTQVPNAPLLLVGGNGLGREGCILLRQLTQQLCAGGCPAAVAYSRLAATNGWGEPEQIAGQSGKSFAPEVCVTFGVSGASAFLAGVKQAKTLLAVNCDKDAPIFRRADYGIVTDALTVLRNSILHCSGKKQ